MNKNDFIIKAVLSLNQGGQSYLTPVEVRIELAKGQADLLEKMGVFTDDAVFPSKSYQSLLNKTEE